MASGFKIIEHPADLGIEARGASLAEAFTEAAYGLISLITDRESVDPAIAETVSVSGADREQLLVKWLSEILYLMDGRRFLIRDLKISLLTQTELRAVAAGEFLSEAKHKMKMDVKAVTYHQLAVREENLGGFVRVFLDI